MSTAPTPAATLLKLLEEQQRLLTQYLELTQAQTALIDAEDVEAFNKNLDKRAQLITIVDGMRPELERLLKDYSNKKFAADGKAIQDLREQISRILLNITEIDNKNRAAAQERMDFFQAELRRAGETRKGLGAYMKGAEIFAAEYVDERQ